MAPVTPPPHPTLFLVDGYALVYRAFFALLSRPLRTARGENTSAAWGVVNFLQRLREQHQPEYLAWVHDSGTSFRHTVYPSYKATREKLTEELQADFASGLQRIEELLAAYHVPVITVEGYEADDVIGSLARQATAHGLNVAIVSGDKDFQQLVREGLWLLNPGRGGPASVEEQWVNVDNGSERLGVPPALVTDYLALVGDTSDNVPGVPGIGDKTAQELIHAYGNLEAILARAPEVAKKRPREALQAYADQARLSKELVTIREDVPVTLDLDTLRTAAPHVEQLRKLFVELEFSSLLRTLDAGLAGAPPATIAASPWCMARRSDDIAQWCAVARRAGRIGLSCMSAADGGPMLASRTDPLRSQVVGLALAVEGHDAIYIPLGHREGTAAQGELLLDGLGALGDGAAQVGRLRSDNAPALAAAQQRALRELLDDPAIEKVGHNLKTDILLLRGAGVTLRGIAFDAMLASYVLDPGRRGHSLDIVSVEFLNTAVPSYDALCGKGKQELSFDRVPPESAASFASATATTGLRLADVMMPLLDEVAMRELYRTIELPLVAVLADMEWDGVAIDVAWLHSLKARFERERLRVEEEIYMAAGERFNINSNPQLRTILFERLKLPVKKRTSTGPSTDVTVLQELADEGHTLPTLLMEYRELSKLESTYLDTLPSLVLPRDHRLHTSYNQTVAATGRLSSSDPNLQNIPIRRELGRDIRRGFVAPEGWLLVAADYSQIELRLLAHLSEDPAFLHAFQSGGDIHRETASLIFGVPSEQVSAEMRGRAKTINFATIYGQGAHALSRQLKISNQEAKEFINTYFERFRGVRAYLDAMVTHAKEQGYVETIFGRRRYIPELKERNFNIRAFGERVATNAPIQGSAADLIKLAMLSVHAAFAARSLRARMILQVHDELVFEAPADERDVVLGVVRMAMEGAAALRVPLVVDIGTGPNWLSAKG